MRVAQVSFHRDLEQRPGAALLDAWPTLANVARATAGAGIDVTIVQSAHRDERVERDGITYDFVDAADRRRTRVADAVRRLCPDVVHVQGLGHPFALHQLAATAPSARVLVQDHGSRVPTGARARAWQWGHRGIAAAAFTSVEQGIPWKASRILRQDLPVLAVTPYSSHFTPGDMAAARVATGLSGQPCLLWTAHLDANKDPLCVLAAFESIVPALPGARLWMCYGVAPLYEPVAQRIASSSLLRERVTLLGTRPHDELEDLFRAADFFVQASHHEGSGYALLEAMACGTTPIVTDIPAFRSIVGDAGALVPVGDAASLAKAMLECAARDPHGRRDKTRAHFDRTLSFGMVGRSLRLAYERVQ